MNIHSIRSTFSALHIFVAAVFVAAFFVFAIRAEAAQSPVGCTADNSVVNVSSNIATAVAGDIITFEVTAGNPTSVNGCDITGRTITLTLPNGTPFVYGPSNYLNPSAVAFVGDENYTANLADLDGGVWTATVSWNGTLKSVSDVPSSGSKGVSVFPVLPLEVVKTASGSFDREWTWGIEKSVDDNEVLLADGEIYTVNYDVDVSASSDDVNHSVEGTITITNPSGNPDATIDELTDIVDELDSGADMVINCGAAVFPVILNGGESLDCSYSGVADGTEDTNTVTVTTSGPVPGNTDTADIVWAQSPANETDECIVVDDTNANGPQDVEVCGGAAPENFSYSITFGPDGGEGVDVAVACSDDFTHPNTASFITNDTDATGDDLENVHVVVNCAQGCTLTQGYWKTHNDSFKGGAPTDDNWENVGGLKELTQFFTSGATWFGVFNTPPKGNAWYNLAHQYMAAKLNVLNGATAPAPVASAIASAEGLFNNPLYNTPAEFAALGKKSPVRTDAINWAGILGAFNEGNTGPGHCDE